MSCDTHKWQRLQLRIRAQGGVAGATMPSEGASLFWGGLLTGIFNPRNKRLLESTSDPILGGPYTPEEKGFMIGAWKPGMDPYPFVSGYFDPES